VRNFFVAAATPLLVTSGIIGFVLLLVLVCAPNMARSYPQNYILLFAFTFCQSISVGGVCAITAVESSKSIVLMAALATSIVVVGLTLFAFQTKYDFTSLVGVMWIVLLGFIAFGLIRMFFPHNKWTEVAYSSMGAMIFGVYLIIDTQLLIGRGKIHIDEEDYILGALLLYIDIINLFLHILKLLSELNRN